MNAADNKRIRRTSRNQEKQVAKDLGGKVQVNSGAVRLGGGSDVRVQGKFRVECKFTNKESYTLKLLELEKLKKQANSTLEYPIFQFSLKDNLGKLGDKYAAISWNDKLEPKISIIANAKQISLSRQLLSSIEYDKPVKITFSTPALVRSYRIIKWDELVDYINSGDHVNY